LTRDVSEQGGIHVILEIVRIWIRI